MKRANGTGGIKKLSGKRRKPYQALITDGKKIVNGKPVQNQIAIGTYATKKDAYIALAEYIIEPVDLSKRELTFSQIYEIVKNQSYWEEAMRTSMNSAFKKCFAIHDLPLPKIKKDELQIVADGMEGMSISSQNNVRLVISFVFTYGMEYDIVRKDYSAFIKFPPAAAKKDKKAYSPKDIKIVQMYGDDVQKVLLYSGMRIAELLDMKVSQVKSKNDILYFDDVGTKTSAARRIIPIHNEIIDIINKNLSGIYLFEPYIGQAKYRKDVYYPFNEKYGVINHTPHDLRRTFSTYAKHCKMDEFYRKYLLGHRQDNITDQTYTDTIFENLCSEINILKY